MFIFQQAHIHEFTHIKYFYWHLIDSMKEQHDKIGWKKGIYPTDFFIHDSLSHGELFTLKKDGQLYAVVILNSESNSGYADIPWSLECNAEDVLIPHALAVSPEQQGKGIGEKFVKEIIKYAKMKNKKVVRLDILGTNNAAEKLYIKCGFQFVQTKLMFYEDTGWTEYKLFEHLL